MKVQVRYFASLRVEDIARRHGRTHGGRAVFGPARRPVVQGAMGDRQRQKGGGQGRAHQASSKMASISTATPKGSEAAETAERA